MSTANRSFASKVGGICSFDRRDRSKSVEIIPLVTCKKDISNHKSQWGVHDVDNEIELILSRASIFEVPEDVEFLTIQGRNQKIYREGAHQIKTDHR